MPAVPAPSGRSAALTADSTPSIASALASMPPAASSASTTATSDRQHQHEDQRRVGGGPAPVTDGAGATNSGQQNTASPAQAGQHQ